MRRPVLTSFLFGCLLGLVFCLVYAADADATQRGRRSTTVPPTIKAAPAPAQGLAQGTFRKRLLMAVVRHHTVNKLQSDKKLKKADAEAAFDKLVAEHPDLVDGAIAEASPEAAAQVQLAGGPLTDFLDWLSTHGDQIMQIVAMIIKILALFGI
jgi:hypothetical protein